MHANFCHIHIYKNVRRPNDSSVLPRWQGFDDRENSIKERNNRRRDSKAAINGDGAQGVRSDVPSRRKGSYGDRKTGKGIKGGTKNRGASGQGRGSSAP